MSGSTKQMKKKICIKVKQTENSKNNSPKIEEMPILEYLEVVKSEYNNERQKKGSFESRAGISFAFIGTLCVFLLDEIKISDIIKIFNIPMTFIDFLKITSGLLVYLSLLISMFYLIKTIRTSQHSNFETNRIDEVLLAENRTDGVAKIIFTYRDVIKQHREANEKRAKYYQISLYSIAAMLISIIFYINI